VKVSPTVRDHGARTTRATVRSVCSYMVARARREQIRKGRSARRGKPWLARRRVDATSLAPGLTGTWHRWLVCVLAVYVGACACSKAQARERVASARVGARRRDWGDLGLRWSARASTRTGVRAQEQPSARAIWVERYRGERRLGSPRRNAGELNFSRGTEKRKGRALSLPWQTRARVRMHGCVDESEDACMRTSSPRPWRRPGPWR
jgi:hypothetical protein